MVAVPQPLATAGAHPMGLRLRRLLDGGSVTGDRLGWIGIVIVVIAAAAALPGAHMPSAGQGDERVVIVIRR